MDNPFNSPLVLSLCTGIGGLERGLCRAIGPIRIAAYVEIEAWACWNLVAKMEQGKLAAAPVWTDVKTFPSKAFHKRIHGIIGGYPCQPFSLAGQRRGADDPRHLWPFIAQHIAAIRPVWCFFENVDDHLTLGFPEVQKSLWRMGYRVEAGVFSAGECGAPHERQRVFILAIALAHCHGKRKSQLRGFIGNIGRWPEHIGEEMEHTINANGFNVRRQKPEPEFAGISNSGGELANPECNGYRESSCIAKSKQFAAHESSWPASPGQPQHPWEHPRTIEPGMGCTIDGYNHQDDILRALGNAVVEQSAELAFRTLIRKFVA
ncbi:MAG: DNA cytosine methyltransferase [Alphaproteobacteria bacterium]